MKNNYINFLILGIMCLTINVSLSQSILVDGDFSVTTEIVSFDTPTPPINTWAFWVNYWGNGSEANPTVVDGVCNFQITNPGYNTWDIQLAQWGFPLTQGHLYQLLFDVKADDYRSFGVFLGEDGGNYTNLIGQDKYYNEATPDWQTISIDFEATSVFTLHKLSFELGANGTTMYFDNIILQDMGLAPPKKIVIAGTFQDEQGCNYDWDPNCDFTALTLNSSTGLYEGTFQIPEGKNRYKVTVGGSWAINYGENGLFNGPDIYLCVPSGSEEITFTYDPYTHLVTTSPIVSGFSADCLPQVVIAGSFQDELGCFSDWVPDCTNTALIYNSVSGLFEADLNIPAGCYEYRVVLENSWENSFGQEGIHYGPNYFIFIPANPDITHFTYDPVSHILIATPYNDPLEEVTKVSLYGSLQGELGCAYDYDFGCNNSALQLNSDTGVWEGSFILPAGCYIYRMQETVGCYNVTFYGENGIDWGNEIQLFVPSDGEITFSYDPQTHIVTSTPYSVIPQEVTKVSLYGTLQDELGCVFDYYYECDNPALQFNSELNVWEGSFTLPAGCYTYQVKETFGCYGVTMYGENGNEWGNEIQLFVPSDGEITFTYDPQTHMISSTPYSGVLQEVTKVSLYGTLQDELGCVYDYDYACDNSALLFNSDTGVWEGSFTLPAGCYTYRVKETFGCYNVTFYGENGVDWGNEIQLYVPAGGEITFSYNPQTHIITSTPYNVVPQEVTKVSLYGTLQDELGCPFEYDYECDNSGLQFNAESNTWEGSFTLPAGCYTYWVKETVGCNNVSFYGENGVQWGDFIQLYVLSDGEITFSYDPQTHIITSTPYTDISTLNQCPNNISVNNAPGSCGAIVNYPEFVATAYCGGDILFITQTEGLPSGSYFPVGITTNSFMFTKITGEEITCSFNVVVLDTEPPVISDLNRTYKPLWPANHKMVPVFIEYFTSDNCNIETTKLYISSNEPVNGPGYGNKAPDWEILDAHNVLLRAERSGKGNGREYYITIKVMDDSGNLTQEVVTITVPHDNGKITEGFDKTKLDKNEFILYPNGVDNVVNIKGPKASSNQLYVIYDLLGVMKKKGTIINDQIDVETLPSGIYILKFEKDNEYIFKKFIKN